MAKIDELKEEIGWLKIIFGILTAIDISILGWLAQNYNTVSIVLQLLALVLVLLSTMGIVIVNKKAYQKMNDIGDLWWNQLL